MLPILNIRDYYHYYLEQNRNMDDVMERVRNEIAYPECTDNDLVGVVRPFEEIRENAQNNLGAKWAYGCDGYYRDKIELADVALAALRPVSREAWTAEWTVDEVGHKCSKCGEYLPDGEDVRKPQFCPECGRAMTDEAVDMVMERMEALHDNRT